MGYKLPRVRNLNHLLIVRTSIVACIVNCLIMPAMYVFGRNPKVYQESQLSVEHRTGRTTQKNYVSVQRETCKTKLHPEFHSCRPLSSMQTTYCRCCVQKKTVPGDPATSREAAAYVCDEETHIP